MQNPGLVILGILAVGVVFVLLPVALTTLSETRRSRVVRCPESAAPANVSFDPARAVSGALIGRVWLSVPGCSLWPERRGCAQACAKAPAPTSQTETAG